MLLDETSGRSVSISMSDVLHTSIGAIVSSGSTDQTVRVWSADGAEGTETNPLAIADGGGGGASAAPVTCMARVSVTGDRATDETVRCRDAFL